MKYTVTVRVSSWGQTSPPETHTTITMIDRKTHTHTHTLTLTHTHTHSLSHTHSHSHTHTHTHTHSLSIVQCLNNRSVSGDSFHLIREQNLMI